MSDGKPHVPDNDLGQFGAGEFKKLNVKPAEGFKSPDDGMATHASAADEALRQFGPVTSHRNSSILSHGPVAIPKEGGPDSRG